MRASQRADRSRHRRVLKLLPCLSLSGDESQELLSQLNDPLRCGDAVGDVVRRGGRLSRVWVLGVITLLAHPVKFPQDAPVLREWCLHELAEYTVPAVAASSTQSLDGKHG